MSKVGQKSLDEVCMDCLYNSSLTVKNISKAKEISNVEKNNRNNVIPEIKHGLQLSRWFEEQEKQLIVENYKTKISFEDVLIMMLETYEKKNNDYGNSFEQLFEEYGMTSSVIRLSDKLSRLKSLQKVEQKVNDESQLDTLLDMASYAIMTYVILNNRK